MFRVVVNALIYVKCENGVWYVVRVMGGFVVVVVVVLIVVVFFRVESLSVRFV